MPSRTYSAKDVILIVGGQALSGYADGTFAAIEPTGPAWDDVIGADGEGAWVKRADDKSGTVTVTLLQTSLSNDWLSALAAQLEPLTVLCKDNLGKTRFAASDAHIQQLPAAEFGKELSTREWVIKCHDLESVVAGNL